MYVPSSVSGESAGLMVSLHGCTQKGDDMKTLGNWVAAAERNKMIVALPTVPEGGVVMGCWDYYGPNHTETNRYNGRVIGLTQALMREQPVDAARVYISGLSSGSAQAMIVGCLRPDLYAGVGLSAGPVVGSEMSDIYQPRISPEVATETCIRLAGPRAPFFQTQLVSIIFDEQDRVVNAGHSQIAAQVMGTIYGAINRAELDLSQLAGKNTRGYGAIFSDALGRPRISYIMNQGLGHAWPSGSGSQASVYFPSFPSAYPSNRYINGNSIDYPLYLGQFFNAARLR